MPVPGVGRVGGQAETGGPIVLDPDLLDLEYLAVVVVLDPGGMPDQPGDGVGAWFGRLHQVLGVHAADGVSGQRRDAVVQLDEDCGNVHGPIPPSMALLAGRLSGRCPPGPPRGSEGSSWCRPAGR